MCSRSASARIESRPSARSAATMRRSTSSSVVEVLTSMCARLYGRRGARNQALHAVTAAKIAGVDAAA
jgi:hypothetical protein